MSDVEPTAGDSLSSRISERMLVFVVFHGMAGIALAWLSSIDPPTILLLFFYPLVLCQCSLVGLWGALGRSPRLVRIVGMLAAAGYLGTELWWTSGVREGVAQYALALLATFPVAAIIGISRQFSEARRRAYRSGAARGGLQFSIRSLMLVMIVIACLLALGRWLDREVLVIGISAVFVALTSIWATVRLANPGHRCGFVVMLSATAGCVGEYALGGLGAVVLVCVFPLQAFFLLVSLAVIRRCGYRLAATGFAE